MGVNMKQNLGDSSFLIATGNPGKRREFEGLLKPLLDPVWTVFDRQSFPHPLEEVDETGETFRENAVKKAVETALASRCCALADDSGLEVDALDGAPGVRSARFAGESATDQENNRLLIQRLEGRVHPNRRARFVAVVCLAMPDNAVARALLARRGLTFEQVSPAAPRAEGQLVRVGDVVLVWFRGTLEGRIVDEPVGEYGFGYDPHFFLPEQGKTSAELSREEKNRISHRAVATRKLSSFF